MSYKIQHNKTGLYFCKSSVRQILENGKYQTSFKSNLSKKGRLYETLTKKQMMNYTSQYYDEVGRICENKGNDFKIVKI
jgi:hypothetical protein